MRLTVAVLVLWVGTVVGRRYYGSLVDDCVPPSEYNSDVVFFPDPFQLVGEVPGDGVGVEVAEDFRVEYASTFKVVQNVRVNETYVLYQCGTPPPDTAGLPSNTKLFEIPLTNVALADVTSSGFLTELGVADRVKFASAYATDPCLQKVTRRCGRIAHAPGSEWADEKELKIQTRRADAVFVSGASNDSRTVAFTATMDPAVLKRAEWVKFVALFFNKEPEANAFFARMVETWEDLILNRGEERPRVAWISFQDFDGDEFFLHFAEYKVDYIEAAGGRTLNSKSLRQTEGVSETTNGYLIEFTNKTRTEAVALLHEILKNVDVVIDETYQINNTAYDLAAFYANYGLDDDLDFEFVRKEKIFRLDKTVGEAAGGGDSMDWYETGVSRPDLVLRDLQVAFGTARHRGHERTWLRDLSKAEVPKRVTHRDCDSFKWCDARPESICPTVYLSCVGDLEYRNLTETVCQAQLCD